MDQRERIQADVGEMLGLGILMESREEREC